MKMTAADWLPPLAFAALQAAASSDDEKPTRGSSYTCEECGTFSFEPDDHCCPICKGRLSGEVTVWFDVPWVDPDDAELPTPSRMGTEGTP